MSSLQSALDSAAARTRFSGVVRVDRAGTPDVLTAYGQADRAHGIAMEVTHQLGSASVTKGFTASTILSIVADGALELTTSARSVLGSLLPLVDDTVTIEHLLSHRSGIADYFDESATGSDDYPMTVPVHRLATTEDYVPMLDGCAQVSAPGSVFEYNSAGFVILALIAERVTQVPFHDLVAQRVWAPAGMPNSAFLRSDALPGSAAIGYLSDEGLRANMLHLPVRGSGDGGAYTTVADMSAFWAALLGGRIVPERWVAQMQVPRRPPADPRLGYGLGLWLHEGGALELHGYDVGVSFRSVHDPTTGSTWTVGSTTNDGSLAMEEVLEAPPPR